jgi:glycerophosphoryl diester phosphodiesterase
MPSSRSRQAELARLGERPFAHRGLHGGGIVENSRSAITEAVTHGYGIEVDVRLSADFIPMVFHDEGLDRLTFGTGPLADRESDDLRSLRFRMGNGAIPALSDVLEAIGGRVPLLIELKASGPAYHQLCWAVARTLYLYPGPVGVMSFNPRVGHWFARHHPEFLRGLVVTEEGKRGWRGRIERRLAFFWAQPDFLAYDIRDLPSAFAQARGVPVYTWTVRTQEERERAARHAGQIIFEEPARG